MEPWMITISMKSFGKFRQLAPWILLGGLLWTGTGCHSDRLTESGSSRSCCRALSRKSDPSRVPPASARSVLAVYSLESAQDRTFENDLGQSVSLDEFKGHPVLVSIFFSSCELLCPMTVANLQTVQSSLKQSVQKDLRVVLISFDPERDTVQKLHAFRLTHHLPAESWSLLRGDSMAVGRLVHDLGMQFQQVGPGRFVHSTHIVALDTQGHLVHRTTHLHSGLEALVHCLETLPSTAASERLSMVPPSKPSGIPAASSLR